MHPAYPLVIAANRDEYFHRPTAKADFWQDYPSILAGRDLQKGGTWLGIGTTGRVAAVTNYREPSRPMELAALSRGGLVSDYLTGTSPAHEYLTSVARKLQRYEGFNLIAGGPQSLWFISTYLPQPRLLIRGVHGISNGDLDYPWPKVLLGKARIARLLETMGDIDVSALFELLADRTIPETSSGPQAGVDPGTQRMLSPIFVHGEDYGTRCSTVLLCSREGKVRFIERSFDQDAMETGTVTFEFTLEG